MANTKISALPSGNPAQTGDLLPIDRSGSNFSVTVASVAALAGFPTLAVPGYFWPSPGSGLTPNDLGNCDPVGPVGVGLITQYVQFYLPYSMTVTRWVFQIDGGASTLQFYAGIYDNTGSLIFDIGAITIGTSTGQFGPGAAHDPGTNMFDASRNPTNSVTLTAGWYFFGWGANVAGAVFPSMGAERLWQETMGVDTTGLPSGVVSRWSHSASFDITGGHLPLITARSTGGSASLPPNFCLIC